MREHEFRGIITDTFNPDWRHGDLVHEDGLTWIREGGNQYEVHPDTVCEYTGRKDHQGRQIYEGDIVRGFNYPFYNMREFQYYGVVEWNETRNGWAVRLANCIKGNKIWIGIIQPLGNGAYYEVIGNKFDNPVLIEVQDGLKPKIVVDGVEI